MNDPVDVLIIDAGASDAAVAWSLATTKMHSVDEIPTVIDGMRPPKVSR